MAFVALYGLNQELTAATAAGAGQLKIDSNAATLIAAELGANFTFAALSDGVNFEIVKITSVTGSFLNVVRAQDGTTTSAFPIGSCLRFVWTTEGITAIAAGGSLVLTGTGVVTATQTGPNAWSVNVPSTSITGALPIEVLGAYPSFEIDFQATYGGCCCSGGGGGSGAVTTVTGSGLANVTQSLANYDVNVAPPNFIAAGGITITGVWPNVTFNVPSVVATGVQSVTGSTKILMSGTLTNPVVNLQTTGVGAATYNGISYDNWGTIVAVNALYVPLVTGSSTNPAVSVIESAGNFSITIDYATTSVPGFVQLAPATAGGSNNAGDATSAVTPAGVNAVLAAYVPPAATPVTEVSASNFTPDTLGNYTTNVASSAIVVPALLAGQKAIITASAAVRDTSVSAPPTWGLGVFNGATLVQGIISIFTGTHYLQFVMNGPQAGVTLNLKTTTLNGTTSIVAQSLAAVILPG